MRNQGEIRKEYIDEGGCTAFIEDMKGQSVLFGDEIDRDVAIVCSPMNGAGLDPVIRVLEGAGFTNFTVVDDQEKAEADLRLGVDPDAGRCCIAVKDGSDYKMLTGNDVGLLLLDFICRQRQHHDRMPAHPVFVKTVETTELAVEIAETFGVESVSAEGGSDCIGEAIGRLEAGGRAADFIFGFDESCRYLTGTYARDMDAAIAALMICEMFAFYKARSVSLTEKLTDIYRIFNGDSPR